MLTITICGSGKQREAIFASAKYLADLGVVVLAPPLHKMNELFNQTPEEAQQLGWKGATFAHFNRIAKSDVVYIVNPDGYLGPSTTLELGYAVALKKLVVAMSPDSHEPARSVLFDFVLGETDPGEAAVRLVNLLDRQGLKADVDVDIAQSVATTWNGTHPGPAIPASAEDFWPIFRQLADVGLAQGAEDELSTVSMGPFRIATTKHSGPVADFVEVLLPATVTGLVGGSSLDSAVGGVLAGATHVFIDTLRRSVVFGRGRDARTRWLTLLFVKSRNAEGEDPDVSQILAGIGLGDDEQPTSAEIEAAVDWLTGSSSSDKSHIALISVSPDGRCSSLV